MCGMYILCLEVVFLFRKELVKEVNLYRVKYMLLVVWLVMVNRLVRLKFMIL